MSFVLTDRVTRSAPVRLRFRDEAAGAFITDGLRVVAYDPSVPFSKVQAFPNASGDYVLTGLPGLAEFENSDGSAQAFSAALLKKKKYMVQVVDAFSRYSPVQFLINAPIVSDSGLPQHRGLFFWEDPADSFAKKTPYVPLFPSSSCPVAPGMGVIRATLLEMPPGPKATAASGAMLTATIHGHTDITVRGIADQKGNIALQFSYPEPALTMHESLPAPEGLSWAVDVAAFYKRQDGSADIFDLTKTLCQPSAVLIGNASTSAAFAGETLWFGKDLLLKTTGQSVLYITPAV